MSEDYRSPSTLIAGLRCRCPRCGQGRLFRSFLKIADRCEQCDLDFSFADPADGPAFFVMTGVGILVITVWAVWAVASNPPIWAQFAVVMPALLIGCLGTLQPVKAWLVAEQYVHKAEEGRWQSVGAHGKAPPGYMANKRRPKP
ncbi:DUF983 domain-containing protein [Phenylobacterium sp.]|jgi:uncharacterized protein (DUF983 family)|uniref:DUF983 domain-containing protein n=1 Tax=Phenylobacterium sp. TaxID=1871053 RepID=UPI0037838F65